MPEGLKLPTNIELNQQQMNQQFAQMSNSLAKSIEKAVDTSKLAREMGSNFEKISTRNLDKGLKGTVEKIREGVKESGKYSQYINGLTGEFERLKRVGRSSDFFEDGTSRVSQKYWNDRVQMSDEYLNTLVRISKVQEMINDNDAKLAKGTKTRAETPEERVARGAKAELGYMENARAITEALNPQEIAQITNNTENLKQELASLYANLENIENRGDAFPKLTQSIELAVISINKLSEKIFSSIGQFEKMSQTSSQTMSDIANSEQRAGSALTRLGEINFAQPVQAQTSSFEQSMQNVSTSAVTGMQQVQQQVENTKQVIAQPITTQIIDTSALQTQIDTLTSRLTLLTTTFITQMNAVSNTIASGFQNASNIVTTKVDEINQNIQNMGQRSVSSMNQLGAQVDVGMQHAITQLTARIGQLETVVRQAEGSTKRVGSSASRASKTAATSFGSIEKSVRKILSPLQKLISIIGGKLTSSFNGLQKSVDKAFSARTFKRGLTTILKYGFGVRSLYFAFRKLRSMVKEGLENLVQYEKAVGTSKDIDSTNYAITELRTSLLYLKNAWAAAFAPVINTVMPILRSLMDAIATVGNTIAKFIGALTNQSVVLNAVKVSAGDYADSLSDASKNAGSAADKTKKLTDRLAAFDDLNVLGKDNDNGGAGGGGGGLSDYVPDPSEMFEYVEAQSDLVDMLKKAWENGDFTGLGETVKNKIIEVLKGLNLNWDEIQSTVTKGATFAGQFLVGLFGDPELFKEVGNAIGEGFNTITYGISSFLDEVEKIDFGGNVAEMLNEFLHTADFKTAGDDINRVITDIINNIDSFVKKIDDEAVATAIEDFINGLDVGEILATASNCVLDVASLIINVTGKLIVDWGNAAGEKWWKDASEGIQSTLDEQEITLEPKFNASEKPIRALADTWLTQLGEFLVHDIGGIDTAEELDWFGKGWDATWTFEGMEDFNRSLADVNKELEKFGLVAPETDKAISEMGGSITTSLSPDDLQAIKQAFSDLGTGISEFFTGVSTNASQLKDALPQIWEDIKNTASSKWVEIKDTVTTKAQELKEKAEQKITDLKDKLSDTWQTIRDNAFEKFTLMRVAIVEIFNTLKETLKVPINGILGFVESMINGIIRGINKAISAINSFTSGLKFPDWLENIPQASFLAGKGLNFNLNPLSEVTIPKLAQGAVIPPNKEFLAMLGDQSSGTNIEAPLDTIKQAVAEELSAQIDVLTNGFDAVVAAINNKDLTIGDKDIGKANARYSANQKMIRGTSF